MNVRALAAQSAQAVLVRGRSLDTVLADPRLDRLAGADRALMAAIVHGVLRQWLLIDTLIDRYLERPLRRRDRDLKPLIAVGIYQLGWMRIPAHAAVSETVSAAPKHLRGLVNALLRRYQREGLPDDLEHAPAALRYAHPEWLARRLRQDWPDHAAAIMAENNRQAPMWLRVNPARTTRDDYGRRVDVAECPANPVHAIRLREPCGIEALPDFAAGAVFVQDVSAQWAAPLLAPAAGERLLDACAAPGGKTAHLAALAPGAGILALDQAPERVARLRDNLERTKLDIDARLGDARRPADWWDGTPFHAILLDVPCSGTGVIRRHPDIKWLRRDGDVDRLAEEQLAMLEALWPTLARGGRLLYCTCSILRDENDRLIDRFLARTRDARPQPLALPAGRSAGSGWQILPGEGGGDGFFYALLVRP